MIKNSEHAYIEWKSKLELVMKEQYNITKQCDYAFGWFHIFCIKKELVSTKKKSWLEACFEMLFFLSVFQILTKLLQPGKISSLKELH